MSVAMDAQGDNPRAMIPDYESSATEPSEPPLVKGAAPIAVSTLLEVDVYSAP